MSVAAERIAEVLSWPERDRADLARQIIASLDNYVETDAEARWHDEIDRRSREMRAGQIDARPENEVISQIRATLHARHQAS
jgi:putative addiction module component (TIGR02574 family)